MLQKWRFPAMMLGIFLLVPLVPLAMTRTASGASSSSPTLVRWRATEAAFARWEQHNTHLAFDGTIQLPPRDAPCPENLCFGESMSPQIPVSPFEEAILSWNIETPPGGWVDLLVRVRVAGEWSGWYTMGIWSATNNPVHRQSVANQSDQWASVAVDTVVLHDGVTAADAFQVKLRLLSNHAEITPVVHNIGVVTSAHPQPSPELADGDPTLWGNALDVPPCSQMVYPDGGEVWCSPTSVAMVLGYWARQAGEEPGPCEPRVRDAVNGVYDFVYGGHGNWPFNVAYAATHGLEGYVTRFQNLEEAERWIARGVPLVVSYGWNEGELDGAPLPFSNGHLAVLSGFDEQGNPIIHDPAAPTNDSVPRTYRRDQWEGLWLSRTAGTVYLIAPPHYFDEHRLFVPLVGRSQ